MYGSDGDFYWMLIILAIICGVAGWGFGQIMEWAFSFVHISFGK